MRPTAEQYERALAYSEEHGVGVERALLMEQTPDIAQVQAHQWAASPAGQRMAAAAAEAVKAFTEAFDRLNATLATTGSSLADLVALIERSQKRRARRQRHASWRARRRSR